ncbi:phosphoribosyltransferase family protein [Methylocapsa sp. D3K7]|uniref:phosphoribosyltransferase n=1 Tax=Methylocapsa sp. D3K7 TaxID=3041435 RepID=UPI00244E7A87|nr:phosphoribosyltransferase family protein [Methylocapsa sp. D3K7]WGJ13793.1 phosphoribosyltransferase family protein [Methylocapsa sp. D3K7]
MTFKNRTDAGRQLAARLAHYKGQPVVLLALPRGGVPVAAEVAAVLGAPIDLVLVRKIGVPMQPELAMGAIVDGDPPVVVRNEDVIRLAGVDESSFQAVCEGELAEITRRRRLYLGGRAPTPVKDRVAIVIDDGIATGATTRAALRAIRSRQPKKLILAVPVGPPDTIETMQDEADEVHCLEIHADFGAIGYFYDDFRQTTDQEVIDILAKYPQPRTT